jgi:hypothetical protein
VSDASEGVAPRIERWLGAWLEALFDNGTPAIRVAGLAVADACRAFFATTRTGSLRYYIVEPPVACIGMARYEHRAERPQRDYFADSAAADAAQREIFARSFDACVRVADALGAVWRGPVADADEPGLGPYFAGIVGLASSGIRLYADFALCNAPGGITRAKAS